jgi:hypothetical protein
MRADSALVAVIEELAKAPDTKVRWSSEAWKC